MSSAASELRMSPSTEAVRRAASASLSYPAAAAGAASEASDANDLTRPPSVLKIEVRRLNGQFAERKLLQCYLLLYLASGDGSYTVNGRSFSVAVGDLILGAPGEEHRWRARSRGHLAAVTFLPEAVSPSQRDALRLPLPGDPRWAAFVYAQGEAGPLSVPVAERGYLETEIGHLGRELDQRQVGFQQAARARLTLLLVTAARLASTRVDVTASPDPLLDELFQVIESGFGARLSLDSVARTLARSPRHLSRMVKSHTGRTVLDWIEERRMEEARRLLLESQDKIDAIAGRVGFSDTSYFRRRFRRVHGMPPKVWRQLNH
jgi:AraC family transcriptional activator of pobA